MKRAVLKPELKLQGSTKQYVFLGVLVVVLIVVWLMNRNSDVPQQATAPPPAITPAPGIRTPLRPVAKVGGKSGSNNKAGRGVSVQEFHPTLKPKDPIDTSKVDPTLQLDLLAKLRNLKSEGGNRSLFDFAGAPALAPGVAIASVPKIHPKIEGVLATGPKRPPPPPGPTPPPPPPPIPLKFYGYTNSQQRQGPKRAFFLEGEDIYVAGEGDMIKSRYKIIRIGVNSAVVEDTTNKNQQTLPLIEELANT